MEEEDREVCERCPLRNRSERSVIHRMTGNRTDQVGIGVAFFFVAWP